MFIRLWAIIKKEFLYIINMKVMIPIIFAMPILQIIIFGFAAVIESKNIPFGVIDRDMSYSSRELRQSIKNSGYFILDDDIKVEKDIDRYFKLGKISGCLIIPVNFERKMKKYGTADVQLCVDGSNATLATSIVSYINGACANMSSVKMPISIETRFLFNPSSENKFFFIPGVFGMILIIIGIPLTAISIVKEKEDGTFEQLNVTPVNSSEVIIGKMIPYIFMMLITSTIFIIVALNLFHLPLRGPLYIIYIAVFCFLFGSLGLGIFVSIVSNTQQQAILTSFLILLPMMLFSGFMFPVENMTGIFKFIAEINPLTHFLRVLRDVFLKGSPLSYLKPEFISMLWADIVIFFVSISLFSKRSS